MNSIQKSLIINKGYNPHLLRSVLRKFWFIPLLTISLFLMLGFIYLRYSKMIYKSSSTIQIEKKDQGKEILEIENINTEPNISSEIELLRSEFLFEKAIDKMNMNVSIFAKGNLLTEELYNYKTFEVLPFDLQDSALCNVPIYFQCNKNRVTFNYNYKGKNFSVSGKIDEHIVNQHFDVIFKMQNIELYNDLVSDNELYFVFNEKKTLNKRLIAGLEVMAADEAAQTILINYTGNNRYLCHDIIQSLSEAFFEYDDQIQKKSSENVLNFINMQLDSIAYELNDSKDSLTSYLKVSNLPDPDEMGKGINDNIEKLQEELFNLQNEIRSLKEVNNRLKDDPNRVEIYKTIPEMLGKSYENSLSKQMQDLYNLLEKKEDYVFDGITDENPTMKDHNIRINNKIESIRRSINAILDRYYSQERALKMKLKGFKSEFVSLPDKKMEYNRLKSLQDLNEKYYTLLAEKKVLYSISKAGFTSNNRILTNPEIPGSPISPNRKMIYGGFLFVGLLIGLTYLAFKYFTFNEINNTEELKMLLPEAVSILGAVPITKRNMDFSQIIVHESPKSMISESLRNIRANMSFINKNAQTIAISSSISGEGKTFVALNLAAILAMSGKRTIVLDLDLRKPKIHLGFNSNNDNGMSNLIINQISLMECIQRSEIPNLDFITAGPIPPNPSELILSTDFQNILEKIKSMYDIIIIDNPPVGLVSDGVQILATADIPIYVFKANYSKRVFAERVKELFEVQQIKSLNVILNGIVPGRGGYGYDYGYNYGYGYGYGGGYYYEEGSTKKKTILERILGIFKRKKK